MTKNADTMKKILVFVLVLAATTPVAFTQNSPDAPPVSIGTPPKGKNFLKMYLGFDLSQNPVLAQASSGASQVIYKQEYASRPFFALAFARELRSGDFWEISGQTNAFSGRQDVYDFELPQIDTVPFPPIELLGTERNHFAKLQYEHNWRLSGESNGMVRTFMGFFVRAQGQWARFEPTTSANFPREAWSALLMPGFVPRLLLNGSKRLQIDLSAPITLGFFGLNGASLENPVLTLRQQRTLSFDLGMANLETQIRIGVSYSLQKPPSE